MRIGGVGWRCIAAWVALSPGISQVHAAFERYAADTRSFAMGVSGVACSDATSGPFINPSRAATMRDLSVSVGFSPAPFALPELQSGSAAVVAPFSFGSLFVATIRSGFRLYRESIFRIGGGSSVGDNLDWGVCVSYYSLAIERYGSDRSLGVDLGVRVHFGTTLTWGFTALNVTGASIGNTPGEIPQVFAAGLSFLAARELVIVLDLAKDLRFPVEVSAGLEYALFRLVRLRAGISNTPSTLNAGIGLSTDLLHFDYGVNVHSILGPTHQVGILLLPGSW